MAFTRFLRFFFRTLPPLLIAGGLLALTGCVSTLSKTPPVPLRVSTPDAAALAANPTRAARNLELFDIVWNQINISYYDPDFNGVNWAAAGDEFAPQAAAAKDDEALYEVFNHMLGQLKDGHTIALTPKEVVEDEKHEVTGIGISFIRGDDQFLITAVYPGSPAQAAGIQAGWRLIARDGQPVTPSTPRPTKGQKIDWVFEDHAGKRVELTITASVFDTSYREARVLREGVGYIRFDEFTIDRIGWLRERMAEFTRLNGVVIDLRANPGGDAIALLYALGYFVDRSQIVMVMLDRAETRTRFVPLGKESARYPGKLVVLVGANSASCSELMAAIIQEQARGTVIGRPTAGKVLASIFMSLPDGGRLQLSLSDMITARGVRLEGNSVQPQIILPVPTLDDLRTGRDPDLERAVEELTKT